MKNSLSRKEKRKKIRNEKKKNKFLSYSNKPNSKKSKFETGLLNSRKSEDLKERKQSITNPNPKKSTKSKLLKPTFIDDDIDPEDLEIKRLEKLLGVGII